MWRRLLPQVMVTKPMSDLCWMCQKNSIAIVRAANQPEEQKSEVKVIFNVTPTTILALDHLSCRSTPPTGNKGPTIVLCVIVPNNTYTPTSRMVTHSVHLLHPPALTHVHSSLRFTTPSTWLSRYTLLPTSSNLGPSTF